LSQAAPPTNKDLHEKYLIYNHYFVGGATPITNTVETREFMVAPVFISYSSRDYEKVRTLVDAIEERGVKCWFSKRDIRAGEHYGDVIVDTIERAPAMVLVFSANANTSEEIKKEIALASQRGMTVIPVRLQDVAPSKAFRYELVTRNWIDLFPKWDEGLQLLVDRLFEAIGERPEPSRQPPSPAPRMPMWVYALVPCAALLVGGGYFWLRPEPHGPADLAADAHAAGGAPSKSDPAVAPTPAIAPAQHPPPTSTSQVSAAAVVAPAANPPAPTSAPASPPAQSAAASPSAPPAATPVSAPAANPPATAAPSQDSTPPPAAPVQAAATTERQSAPPAVPLPTPTPTPPATSSDAAQSAPAPPVQLAAMTPQVPPKSNAPAASKEISVGPPPPFDPNTTGGQIFKECDKCPEMAVTPRGSALLGSPPQESGRQSSEPAPHEIVIAQPFAVGRFDVTFDEWDACVAEGGCNNWRPGDFGFGRGRHPVVFVSWNDAEAYVAWLKQKTGQPYRLLSEAEWEYAARGCTTLKCPNAPFWFGQITPELANYDSRYAYEGSPKGLSLKKTSLVDQGAPNPFGLYNMLGNVRQWVADCWSASPPPARSDPGPRLSGDCADRAVRGGSWSDKPQDLRAAARSWAASDERSPYIGFRVARALGP